MKKSPVSNSSNHKAMGSTPNYSQKGWSSERVTQAGMSSRRHTSLAGLTPFNSGRTLPSKWDEAERWICSPLSGYVSSTGSSSKVTHGHQAQQPQRRPKSKSGPIVAPPNGIAAYYTNSSPLIQGLALGVKSLVPPSPFSTGVLAPDSLSLHHYEVDNHGVQCSCPTLTGVGFMPLSTAPRWSDLLCDCDPSSPNSQPQDDKDDESKEEDGVMCVVSKRDKGTQMSPESEGNEHSPANSSSPSSAMDHQQTNRSAKLEVRDVEMDSQATIVMWSKRHATKMTKSNSLRAKRYSETSTETEAEASSWDLAVADSNINISKAQREEAKINAWENLQRAKAEAAIRKLEVMYSLLIARWEGCEEIGKQGRLIYKMKLEKKRSSSMDKILNKLRWAEMKAEKMRGSIPAEQRHQTSKAFWIPKYANIWPKTSCFSSHDM